MFTCTSRLSRSQRWQVGSFFHHTFLIGDDEGARFTSSNIMHNFTLVLVARNNSYLESTFSTMATSGLNNTHAECTDSQSHESVKIKIAGLDIIITYMCLLSCHA